MKGFTPHHFLFMWYTYILKSEKYNQLYIGSTNNINRRLKEHNNGDELSTKRYRPWEVLYYEAYQTEDLARLREKRLKYNGNAMRELKKRIGILPRTTSDTKSGADGLPSTTFRKHKSGAGFTFVELIIYVTIIGVVLVLMAGFLWNIIFGNIKETAYQEVQQNTRFALTKITQETKKATGINNPPAPPLPNTSDTLSLSMADGSSTIFDVFNEKLRITQGSPPTSFYLTSNQVIVSSLQFTNLSYSDTPGTIRVEITINHVNPDARAEYEASVNLKSSISLVPGGAAPPFPYLAQLHYRWRNDDGGE